MRRRRPLLFLPVGWAAWMTVVACTSPFPVLPCKPGDLSEANAAIEGGDIGQLIPFADTGCMALDWGSAMAPDSLVAFRGGRDDVYLRDSTFWVRGGASPSDPTVFRPVRIGSTTGADAHVSAVRCEGNRLLAGTSRGLEWVSNGDLSSGIFRLLPDNPPYSVTGLFELDGGHVLAQITNTYLAGLAVCDLLSNTCQASADRDLTPAASVGLARDGPALVAVSSLWAHVSKDSGAHWQEVAGLPPGAALEAVLEAAGNFYIATEDSGIYKSVDQGTTFHLLPGSPTLTGSGVPLDFRSVTALGKRGDVIFAGVRGVGASAVVFRSVDGGASFTETAGSRLGVLRIQGFAETEGALWAATSAGVFRSADGGSTWSSEAKGLTAPTVHRLASGGGAVYAVAQGQASDVFRTLDGGRTWSGVRLPRLVPGPLIEGLPLASIATREGTGIVLDSGGQGIYRTLDGGATWASLQNRQLFSPVTGIALTDTGVFASDCCSILWSGDLGATWTRRIAPYQTEYGYPPPIAVGHAVVFSAGQTVYRSGDDGNTWMAGEALPGYVGTLVASGGTLLAGVTGGIVFRSADLGATWHQLPGTLPTAQAASALSESAVGLFAGTDMGLFFSHDGGATFDLFDRELAGVSIRSVIAGDTAIYVGTEARGVVTYPVPRRLRRLVPVALDVDTGRAHYTTELALTNRGTSRIDLTFLYTASLGSGSGSATDTLVAGQLVIPDVLAYLRQRGLAIPTVGEQAGTLLIAFEGVSDSGAVSALARTGSETVSPRPEGRASLAYAGVDPDAEAATVLFVYGLRSTPADRSNVAVYNPCNEPVTFSVTAFSGDGSGASALLGASVTLPPWGWTQYDGVLARAGFTNGWVEIRRVSAIGAIGAYGVINDNVTNDGSFILATRPSATPLFVDVPVLVESSAFQSELVLTNAGDEPATLALTYVEAVAPAAGRGAGATNLAATIELAPRTQRILSNAVEALRSAAGAAGADAPGGAAGALHVAVASGGSPGRLYAGARTASPAASGGRFGLFTPGALAGDEATTGATISGLRSDGENRTNVAAVNTATDAMAGPVTLRFEALDGDAGGMSRGSETVTLAPGQWKQLDGFLGAQGVRNGWVRITRTSGAAPWIAYGVVNDGGAPGQRTGDGAYVPMERP